MKKKIIKSMITCTLVCLSIMIVNAYNTQIWSPIQFVKKLFVTNDGSADSSKSTIVLNGENGRIDAKSIYMNGKLVATEGDIDSLKKGVVFKKNGTNAYYNGGNVGIGTSNPTGKLQVNGNIVINDRNTQIQEGRYNTLRVKTSNGYVDIGPMNGLYSHFDTDRPQFYFNKKIIVDSGKVSSYDRQDLQLQTNGGDTKVTIKNSNGNVGIGTTNPQAKLDVNGDIRAKNIYSNGQQVATKADVTNAVKNVNIFVNVCNQSNVGKLNKRFQMCERIVKRDCGWYRWHYSCTNKYYYEWVNQIPLPKCSNGYVLTSYDGKNFKCVKASSITQKLDGRCTNIKDQCLQGVYQDISDDSNYYRWKCFGLNGGSIKTCSLHKPVNGVCNNGVVNGCRYGNVVSTWNNSSYRYWRCSGLYGGKTSSQCSKHKPVNGVCNNSVVNGCRYGNVVSTWNNGSYRYWRCSGLYGGKTSSQCSKHKPINGVCSSSLNRCNGGSFHDISDTSLYYKWQCIGSYGGTTTTCSKLKVPSEGRCSGNGYIGKVPDRRMDDTGPSGSDDDLYIYCKDGVRVCCLSKEYCYRRNRKARSNGSSGRIAKEWRQERSSRRWWGRSRSQRHIYYYYNVRLPDGTVYCYSRKRR